MRSRLRLAQSQPRLLQAQFVEAQAVEQTAEIRQVEEWGHHDHIGQRISVYGRIVSRIGEYLMKSLGDSMAERVEGPRHGRDSEVHVVAKSVEDGPAKL